MTKTKFSIIHGLKQIKIHVFIFGIFQELSCKIKTNIKKVWMSTTFF